LQNYAGWGDRNKSWKEVIVPVTGRICDFGKCSVKSYDVRYQGILAVALTCALHALGQHVADFRASVVSVALCQAPLKSTTDPLLLAAIQGLHCFVVADELFPFRPGARL
jgi:hypothetical protein